ncbi:MAG: MFS transporter [Alphaproteobacteria bacterium]|nr:MFS transporter [Alphaproteobacteria bacterium]
MKRLLSILPSVVLAGLSLALFGYVGYGEATRVYSDIRIERHAHLATTLRHSVNQFAQSGLPLEEFIGFERRLTQLSVIDDAIAAIALLRLDGSAVFCSELRASRAESQIACSTFFAASPSGFTPKHPELESETQILDGNTVLRLPVRDKFSSIGHVAFHIVTDRITARVDQAFELVVWGGITLFVLFALCHWLIAGRPAGDRRRWLSITFLSVLVLMVAVLVVAMFDLYRKGIEGQAEALAQSMASRLSAATDLGIPIDSFHGVQEAMARYKEIDPDIAAIFLVNDGVVYYHSDGGFVGTASSELRDPDRMEFSVPLAGQPAGHELTLTVQLPLSVVIEALGSGARNFIALFFGCALFSIIVFRAMQASVPAGGNKPAMTGDTGARFAQLQAAYFLGIFADALIMSILPETADETAKLAGLSHAWVPLPFTLFFVGITAVMIPASLLTERIELRRLLSLGAVAVTVGLFVIGLEHSFWALCVGRMISGIGQGVLLIAVQAYAFEIVGSGERTRAAGVQVLGYSGGLIVGTGIGGLLAVFNRDQDVILMAAMVGVVAMLFTHLVLPPLTKSAVARTTPKASGLYRVFRFPDFLAVLGMVGVSSKFALAGVMIFAMPLVLHKAGYADDQVSQALMVFAVTTYLVTVLAPRLVSWLGSLDRALVAGMLALAAGMIGLGMLTGSAADQHAAQAGDVVPPWLELTAARLQMSLSGWGPGVALGAAIAVSVIFLGIGQGLIAAPVIARIAASRAATVVGRDQTLATYRLSERAGHILGPVLVGQLLVLAAGNPTALAELGLVFLAIAVLFAGVSSALGASKA